MSIKDRITLHCNMQPDPWGGEQPDHKQPEAVMMGTVSAQPSVLGQQMGIPGQVIMVQQPSSAD